MRTLIRNGRVIAFEDGRHVDLNPGCVVFEGGEIRHVGADYDGPADTVIDATGRLVIPGFVNAHLHVTDTPFTRGMLDDMGDPNARSNAWGLYRVLPAVRNAIGREDELVAAECAFAELLLSGSTTVVELGFDFEMMEGGDISTTERIADIAARLGIRSYIGPRYRSFYWKMGPDFQPAYHAYPNAGQERFEECVSFCKRYDGAHGGLVRAMLAPGQVDTCAPDLLKATRRAADEIGVPIQLHAGQSPTESRTIAQKHGLSTLGYIRACGLMGPDFIIGHGMFLTEDGSVGSLAPADLDALVESGTTIAHLPWVKARQGGTMRSFGQFLKAGVRMALGTDTYPFDMFQEMRCAAQVSRIEDGSPCAVSSHEVFRAATIGGAEALGRPDLGRLAKGARADIVLVDITRPHAVPMRDPLAFLVFSATGADVDTVIVDGRTVVRDRRLLTTDLDDALGRLSRAGEEVYARIAL